MNADNFIQIFTEKAPFANLREPEVIGKVGFSDGRPSRPPQPAEDRGLTDEVWSLMENCWAVQPGDRPSMMTVLARIRASR